MSAFDDLEALDTTFTLYLISSNALLKEQLEKVKGFSNIVAFNTLEPSIRCKAIVADGHNILPNELKELRQAYPNIPIYYQFHDITNHLQIKSIKTTCGAYAITPLSEHYSVEQIAEQLELELFSKENAKKQRVISFFGTHSGAGVSTTVFNVADVLGLKVTDHVLVLSLNPWDPSDYFLPYDGAYLNDLKIELMTDSLTEEKFISSVMKHEHFYHLAGNRDIKLQRYYNPQEIEKLIQMAQRTFDVVLIDAGTHFDNAAYAQSYKSADLKFLVTTQDPKGFRGYWPHIFNQLIEPVGGSTDEFLLIINKFTPDLALITEKDLSTELGINLLTSIPNEQFFGATATAQRKLLHEVTPDKNYGQSLENIVNAIISRGKLTINYEAQLSNTKKGFMERLFGKKVPVQESTNEIMK